MRDYFRLSPNIKKNNLKIKYFFQIFFSNYSNNTISKQYKIIDLNSIIILAFDYFNPIQINLQNILIVVIKQLENLDCVCCTEVGMGIWRFFKKSWLQYSFKKPIETTNCIEDNKEVIQKLREYYKQHLQTLGLAHHIIFTRDLCEIHIFYQKIYHEAIILYH